MLILKKIIACLIILAPLQGAIAQSLPIEEQATSLSSKTTEDPLDLRLMRGVRALASSGVVVSCGLIFKHAWSDRDDTPARTWKEDGIVNGVLSGICGTAFAGITARLVWPYPKLDPKSEEQVSFRKHAISALMGLACVGVGNLCLDAASKVYKVGLFKNTPKTYVQSLAGSLMVFGASHCYIKVREWMCARRA